MSEDKHYGFERLEYYAESYFAYNEDPNLYADAMRILGESPDFYKLPDGSIICIGTEYLGYEGSDHNFYMVRSENEHEELQREKFEEKQRKALEKQKEKEKAERQRIKLMKENIERKTIEHLRKKGYTIEPKQKTTRTSSRRSKAINLPSEDGSGNS